MAWYLESRKDRPLHLTIWVPDRAEHQTSRWKSGSHRPLCGAVGDGWTFTGHAAEKWRPRSVCLQCLADLRKLQDAAVEAVPDA